jgi:hypothetical protein
MPNTARADDLPASALIINPPKGWPVSREECDYGTALETTCKSKIKGAAPLSHSRNLRVRERRRTWAVRICELVKGDRQVSASGRVRHHFRGRQLPRSPRHLALGNILDGQQLPEISEPRFIMPPPGN